MGGISDEELLEKDLYEILGVSQSSSEDEIRNAYKKKARRLHPGNIPKNICEYFLKVFSKFFPGFFEPLKKIQIYLFFQIIGFPIRTIILLISLRNYFFE